MPAPAPPLFQRVRAAMRLPAGEVARAAEAVVLFRAYQLALRVVPVKRLLGEPGPPAPEPTGPPPDRPAVRAVRRALRRAARPHPDTCLAQSLAGRAMLRRRGLPTALSLGARQTDDGLAFHAWLRSDGVLVNDGGRPGQFSALSTFTTSPAARAATPDPSAPSA